MQTLRRTAIALVVAVALVVIAGLGVFRQLRADARGPAPSTAALDAPIVPGATLDQTIADLQTHLAAALDDAHGFAELGLAYSAQASRTGDPLTTRRPNRPCRRRCRSSPTTTPTR
jgi:cytochrome c-type biogenesis protein CcmH/NrfG